MIYAFANDLTPSPLQMERGRGWLRVVAVVQVENWIEDVLASPPWGRRERGLVFDPLCPLDISPKFQSAEFRGDSAMSISLQLG